MSIVKTRASLKCNQKATLEGVNRSLNRPIAEFILSTGGDGRNPRFLSLTQSTPASRATRSANRNTIRRSTPLSTNAIQPFRVADRTDSVSDEERQYIETFENLFTPNGPLRNMLGHNSRFQVTVGGRSPFHPNMPSSGERNASGVNPSDDVGSFVGRVRALIDGLHDARAERISGTHASTNRTQSGGDTAATAIEIDDSDSEE